MIQNSYFRFFTVLTVVSFLPILPLRSQTPVPKPEPSYSVTIDLNHGYPVNSVVPRLALGAALDGMNLGDIDQVYTAKNLAAMRAAGLHSLTYRLRTELGIEAWHWNPAGSWSDAANHQGYWTSSAVSKTPIQTCNGYWLPRRGNTFDEANNEGYSRLDDGRLDTFWKSNPYLCPPFVHENHPQWILIGFKQSQKVDTLRIAWTNLYATRYTVQYFVDADHPYFEDINDTLDTDGHWQTFPFGVVKHGRGGTETVRLCSSPISVQYVRIRLLESSKNAAPGPGDIRDRIGYAVRELYLGKSDADGTFHDLMQHGATSSTQTMTYVSSTDPWHRASDIDTDTEQPGFDRVFKSGLSDGLPVMLPISMFYGTPENAVAEVKFIRSRGYPVRYLEMGEEPDGQYLQPEDYGAFFIRFAEALHKYDPTLILGGPCFQGMTWTSMSWPDETGTWLWVPRFINYLKSRHELGELGFWSTEAYFFDDIASDPAQNLLEVPTIVNQAVDNYHKYGVPASIPIFVTEYGYSPYATQTEVDIPGALLDADFLGTFFAAGGKAGYFYGIEPNSLMLETKPGATWGNLTMFLSDDSHVIKAHVAAYEAIRMVAEDWMGNSSNADAIYRARTNDTDASGRSIVTVYALRRPDGAWSVMLINKNPMQGCQVNLSFINGIPGQRPLNDKPSTIWQYSHAQYIWRPNGEHGYAKPNNPPVRVEANPTGAVHLPPYSLTVVSLNAAPN